MTAPVLDAGRLARDLEPRLAGGSLSPSPALVDAWRQAHYAAQAASEVGKGWAAPQEDDSHSAFSWRAGALHGATIAAPRPFHAALRIAGLALALEDEAGATLAARSLSGTTSAEALAWARAEARRLAGPPRQAAVPAPDLPPHPLATGARFAPSAALAALARGLAQADAILRRFAAELPGAGSPRCWPHHFDLAILTPLARDPDGAPSASFGLGLAVPDDFSAGGYWYASPGSTAPPARLVLPPLPHGRWAARGAGLPLGVLPLEELAPLTARAAAAALAGFAAAALDAAGTLAQTRQTATRRDPG